MKIMLIIGGLTFGGAERVICNLANYFVEKKENKVILVAISKKTISYDLNEKIIVINGIDRRHKVEVVSKLRGIIVKNDPDIILSFLTQINVLTLISSLGLRTKVVISERNNPKAMPKKVSLKLLRAVLYPTADGVVFQTKNAKEYFQKHIQKKSIVIPNPIFLECEPKVIEKKENKIVCVSRLVPQKNQEMLIRSFSNISEHNQSFSLHFYGDGPELDKLKKISKDLLLNDKIKFHGEVKNIHEKIRNAKIFVLPSNFEGMPNALMEAMALGLACISTNCSNGGPAFLIQNYENGILIPVGDGEKLEEAMDLLINNEKLRSTISMNAMKINCDLDSKRINESWLKYLTKTSKVLNNESKIA